MVIITGVYKIVMTRARKILIIDDDRAILRVFTRVLNRKGYFVATAETGEEAWEKLTMNRYDAALIDVKLPDMEGTDLLPLMLEIAPKMLKIVYTGFAVLGNSNEFTKKGVDAFLVKPVNPETLLNILQEKLTGKSPAI